METIKNIVYSENLLGSEEDIDFFSLIFRITKLNNRLNVLEIFNFLLNKDKEKVISEKKYYCVNPENKILDLLSQKGAIDLDKYIQKIEKKYMNVWLLFI